MLGNQTGISCQPLLTVRAAVQLQTHSDASSGGPVHRDQADVAGEDGVLQLVADHALAVGVALKHLRKRKHSQVNARCSRCDGDAHRCQQACTATPPGT